jgi:hypothetical protein
MGTMDRVIRLLLAAVFSVLYVTQTVSGTLGIVLLVAGSIFILTSFISFCPIYHALGIKTCKTSN